MTPRSPRGLSQRTISKKFTNSINPIDKYLTEGADIEVCPPHKHNTTQSTTSTTMHKPKTKAEPNLLISY